MSLNYAEIKDLADDLEEQLIEVRRTIHENPELGFKEYETAKLIKSKLEQLGIEYKDEIAITGIVGFIEGEKSSDNGKTLLIRADMDALPLQEDNDAPYKSKNDGVMHACGHDTHVSCLLGVAEILSKNRDKFGGKVLLTFQPAEETAPDYDPSGKIVGGAKPMLIEAEDIFGTEEEPKIDAALALHIIAGDAEEAHVGKIGMNDGPFTGSADEVYITIKGKGGHASAPHTAVDPVYIASQVYVAIQGYLSRTIDPMEPVVFTIGKILGGDRQNIISSECKMEGTLRTLNEEVRNEIKEKLPEIVKKIAESFGGDAEFKFITGYPVGKNSEEMNNHIRKAIKAMYGDDAIQEVGAQLGAEDFYEFGFKNKIPIAMFWLGGANPDREMKYPNHSNYFDIDEKALPIGTAILAATAISYLNDY